MTSLIACKWHCLRMMETCMLLSMKMGKITLMSTLKCLTRTEAVTMRLIDADLLEDQYSFCSYGERRDKP